MAGTVALRMSDAAHERGLDRSHREPASATGSRAMSVAEFESAFTSSYSSLVVLAAASAGRSDAEDVVSEAAVVALKKLDSFEAGSNFGAWMATIVRYVASNTTRGERRRRQRIRRFALLRPGMTRAGASPPTGDGREFSREIQPMLDQLSPAQRECLLLRVALSHSYEEIASITGISPATARSHVLRARRRVMGMSAPGRSHDE